MKKTKTKSNWKEKYLQTKEKIVRPLWKVLALSKQILPNGSKREVKILVKALFFSIISSSFFS